MTKVWKYVNNEMIFNLDTAKDLIKFSSFLCHQFLIQNDASNGLLLLYQLIMLNDVKFSYELILLTDRFLRQKFDI